MAKPQKKERIELTLRLEDEMVRRLEWIELRRRDLKFRNDALIEALGEWLAKNEAIFGTDPDVGSSPKRKRA